MFVEKDVLQKFPKFELCYEILTHKKVHNSNIMLAIPEGKQYVAWFTNYNNNNVCVILNINENKIEFVKKVTTSFTDKLALGTIFYGTLFCNNSMSYFCIEDIYYYAGKPIYSSYLSKLELLKNILNNDMSQIALDNKFTIFGLPLLIDDFQVMLTEIQKLPYNVSYIKFRFFDNKNAKKIVSMKYFKPKINTNNNNTNNNNTNNNNTNNNNTNNYNTNNNNTNNNAYTNKTTYTNNNAYTNKTTYANNNKKMSVFKVMADIDPDIYHLFNLKNGIEEYYDMAFVPDYKTSVMMNLLFRNIKENTNLDAIEESDNEDDFENSREDKYVYLDRSFNMNCEYNHKFKRWVPISLAEK